MLNKVLVFFYFSRIFLFFTYFYTNAKRTEDIIQFSPGFMSVIELFCSASGH